MASGRGAGTGRNMKPATTTYVKKTTPNGGEYWLDPSKPHQGYLVDPSKTSGAIAYPIEYINWLFRVSTPTARDVRPASAGVEAREIGGQALGGRKAVVYGQARLGPSIFFGPRTLPGNSATLVVGYGLSHGPCDSLVQTIFPHGMSLAAMQVCGGSGPSAAYNYEFFPGELSPASTYSGFLASVSGSSAATFERYPGLCYVGATLKQTASNCWKGISGPFPIPMFVLKGRKVRNFSTGLDTWTDNPAWCLADYIESRRYGQGAKVNQSSVIEAASYCDETFLNTGTGQQEKKHTLNYVLIREAQHKSHIDALRAHFRCSVIERGGEFVFLIDKDRPVSMSFSESEAVPISVQRMGGSGIPNAVKVSFIDPSDKYDLKEQWARTSGAEAGTVPLKPAEYELEGFNKAVWAASEAFFLLNTRLNNLKVILKAVHPKAMQLEPNDVIAYTTSSFGMSGFLLRVIKVTRAEDGTSWMVECVGHDPAVYSFQSRALETYPLPALPDANAAPPAPTGLTLTDVGNNTLQVTWTPPTADTYSFYSHTRVTLTRTKGASSVTTVLGEVASGPLLYYVVGDDASYVAKAKTVNIYGAESAEAVSGTVVARGPAESAAINLATAEGWGVAPLPADDAPGSYGGDFLNVGDGNSRDWGTDPFGRPALLWKGQFNTSLFSDAGYSKQVTGLDPNKPYMSLVYIRRTSVATGGGSWYFGLAQNAALTLDMNGTGNANPYFVSGPLTDFAQNEWYVLVGIIHPNNSAASVSTGISGAYRISDGSQIKVGTDYKMGPGATIQVQRVFAPYNTSDVTVRTELWGPGFYEINGNEPSLWDIIGKLGPTGAAGINGVGFTLSNESHAVPSNTDGSSPVLTGANGVVKVMSGSTDVTASATFGAAVATGCTGTVNTATNTPVAGQPKGYYQVTAMSADNATLDIPVTYGSISVTLRFSLSKSKQGVTGVTGANAKTMTVGSDRQTIKYDTAGALSPASQTTTFTVAKQNTTATVTWTMTRLDGTALTASTYLSATTGDSVTMTAANFNTARGATEGVIVIATLTDGVAISDRISVVKVQDGAVGATGAAGVNGVGYTLTNEAHAVPSNTDGSSPDLSGANGNVKVMSGTNDVTATATYGAVVATGCTGTVNTADNTPVAGQLKGYYRVTAMSTDTATLDIPVTYSGVTVTLRFSLSKSKQGVNAKTLALSSDRQIISFDGAGQLSPATQTTTFTVNKQNTTATVTWTMTRLDGSALTASTYLSATTGDSVTMTAANFNTARGSTEGVIVIGTVTDGTTISDRISIVKVQAGTPASTAIATNNAMAAVGGRILVALTTKLTSALTTGAASISVESNVLASGDRIVLQKVVGGVQQTEYMAVTGAATGTGPYTYTVTRNLDGSGADAWAVDDPVVNLGQTGNSFIDIYSARGLKAATEVGPSVVGNIRNSSTYNDWTPRWVLGNLNGVFGYSSNVYGAAFGVPTGPWLKIDPINGIRIGHNATTKMTIDAGGAASFVGEITAGSGSIGGWSINPANLSNGAIVISSSGVIAIGSPWAYNNASTPFYADDSGLFSLGQNLLWDGANLIVRSGEYRLASDGFEILSSGSVVGGLLANVGVAKLWAGTTFIELWPGQITLSQPAEIRDEIYINDGFTNNKVIGPQGAGISDASATLASLTSTVNSILSRLRASTGHGLIAG